MERPALRGAMLAWGRSGLDEFAGQFVSCTKVTSRGRE